MYVIIGNVYKLIPLFPSCLFVCNLLDVLQIPKVKDKILLISINQINIILYEVHVIKF